MEGIISIDNSKYTSATVHISSDSSEIKLTGFDNIGKVFNGDSVNVVNHKCSLVTSNINGTPIIGLLNLYSKYKFKANKKGIERFKFKPLSPNFPEFLVASRLKRQYNENILVVIKYLSWNEYTPFGELICDLGTVSCIDTLYNGVLYKYNLNKVYPKISKNIITDILSYEFNKCPIGYKDIRHLNIISIDPPTTRDIDDALSFELLDDGVTRIGVHISDVIGTLNYMGISETFINDSLNTSVYAPHKTVNMLPEFLSTNMLSLLPDKNRLTLTLWLTIKDCNVIESRIEKCLIQNRKNFSYDEFDKHCKGDDSAYYNLYNNVRNLCYRNLHSKFVKNYDSHKLIEKLMIIYNCEATEFIIKSGNKPVYRIHEEINMVQYNQDTDSDLSDFLKIITNKAAKYTFDNSCTGHYALGLYNYTHFTSPIRRFVDCYNHYLVHTILTTDISQVSINLEQINFTNSSIKKADRMFSQLRLSQLIAETHEHLFQGYIYNFDPIKLKVSIYIPSKKITLTKNLIDKKIENLYTTNIYDKRCIDIIEKDTGKKDTYEMYKLLNMSIYNVENKYDPYSTLVIKFID